MKSISQRIAEEIDVREEQVIAAIQLLDEGATVPFIARYRKEITGSLTDVHLRYLLERLGYLRDMEARREAILKSIRESGQLTPKLEQEILAADSKTRLEDLYLPFRPKRHSKATAAREAGLEPLFQHIQAHLNDRPEEVAQQFINPGKNILTVEQALEGARDILVDILAEDAQLLGELRTILQQHGVIQTTVIAGQEESGSNFSDYFNFQELLNKIPSHRALAMLRGKSEGVLRMVLVHEDDTELSKEQTSTCEERIIQHLELRNRQAPGAIWMLQGVRQAWRKRISGYLENDLIKQLTQMAHKEAIRVFANNLKDLLLAAPAGQVPVIGLDPGLRTGVKVAVVDATGKVCATDTLYPHPPHNQALEAVQKLATLAKRYQVKLIAIGNGTASRETDRLVGELRKLHPELHLTSIVISESGASVYSASEYASKELPELDVTLRGAVSIARRLQDPLAELVKIDPKSIGVGQYQHDVEEKSLMEALNGVVEDAVNAVGVDVNTASPPLLERVSGLNATLALNIVNHRNEFGPFPNRKSLKKVTRFGLKTYELAAGFLRIRDGDTPLDASAVHPESYPVVERIMHMTNRSLKQLIGNHALLRTLHPFDFVDNQFGEPTIQDILLELEKPGRDPRPEFKTATFKEGVESLQDLKPGMILEGVVTNITNFGAFVDLGVHQDGLVHISVMSDRFIKDPHEIIKTGDVVKVRVLEIDTARRRIALSMRLEETPSQEHTPNTTEKAEKSDKNAHSPSRTQRQATKPQTKTEPKAKSQAQMVQNLFNKTPKGNPLESAMAAAFLQAQNRSAKKG
ncbi:MAG: RNA-binding transcriptional accessory protein [Magnetococcus sp. DMHC-6]